MKGTIERILLVDDEITFLKAVKRHLRRKGFVLESAGDGRQASRLIRKRAEGGAPFDLIISDVVMPDMDGIELLDWVKRCYPEISFILLTGFGEGDAVSRAVRPGIDCYGAKPITPEKMLGMIAEVSLRRSGVKGKRPEPWKEAGQRRCGG